MAGGEAAPKDARFPQFASQIGSPTPRFAALGSVPDSRSAARSDEPSSIGKTMKGDGHGHGFS